MAAKSLPALNDVITISPPKDKACRVAVQVKLNGGALTLAPRAKLSGTDDLVTADLQTVEYFNANARSTKLTADIATAGLRVFEVEGFDLVLTATAVTGAPAVYYAILGI